MYNLPVAVFNHKLPDAGVVGAVSDTSIDELPPDKSASVGINA